MRFGGLLLSFLFRCRCAAPEVHAYRRRLLDYTLLAEYKRLRTLSPDGLYVLPCYNLQPTEAEEDGAEESGLRRWFGVLFVHAGMWRGGVFKFVLDIPLE